ncbi:MAG: catalase family protein, partial [Nannocystaceae bacterium]|nr:catalase family protein [Nannocystaceae bacterium]
LLGVGCRGEPASREPAEPIPDLAPAQEWVPAGEAAAIAETKAMLEKFVKKRFDATGTAHRDAHVKSHGCVQAHVTVYDGLADNLAVGLFAAPKTYAAWIRFSNSADAPARDRKPDGRGMAIKLMNVPGEKALPGQAHETSQDIILINYPVFVVRDAADYVEFTRDSTTGHPLRFFFGAGMSRIPELKSAEHLALQKVVSPISPAYYSMTPYLLGEGQAAKYGARPCTTEQRKRRRFGKDYLRKQLVDDLGSGGACFELMLQVQTDVDRMPIEDPTVGWPESLSPYVPVARIDIPAQTFDSEPQRELCEYLTFNPWHTKLEHRPLGGINRVRKAVYGAIASLRHGLDGVAVLEPTDHDVQGYLKAVRGVSSVVEARRP